MMASKIRVSFIKLITDVIKMQSWCTVVVQYFVGPMWVPSTEPNGVAAPVTTPSQVKPKKRTMILFKLYIRKYIRSATDAREKT
jgi:hypothetical protein